MSKGELIGPLLHLAVVGKLGVLLEIVADVGATPLDEVLGQCSAALLGREVHRGQGGVEESDEVAEGPFVARVRRGRHEQQVAGRVVSKVTEQPITLGAATRSASGVVVHRAMGFIDDDEIRGSPEELVPPPVRLDEVGRDDRDRMTGEDRLVAGQAPFEVANGAGQDQLSIKTELLGELLLPLGCQARRAQDGQARRGALGQELGCDQAGLNGLADADVVGDEEADGLLAEGEQQRDELVGPRGDRQPREAPERSTGRAETDAQRVPQQASTPVVPEVFGTRWGERGGPDVLMCWENSRDVILASTERSQDQTGRVAVGQDHPVSSACAHQRPHGIPRFWSGDGLAQRESPSRTDGRTGLLAGVPKTAGLRRMTSHGSSAGSTVITFHPAKTRSVVAVGSTWP